MKQQDQSSSKAIFSASALREVQAAYGALDRAVRRQPWIAQGSVNVVDPGSSSANVTYTWTRKVRAKTVTVALSRKQAGFFRKAIMANRRIEEALARLRQGCQTALLANLPGVTERRKTPPKTAHRKLSQKELK